MASDEQTDEAGDSSESSDLWRLCASRIQETGWVRARVALEAPKLGALIAWSAVRARGQWPEPIALRWAAVSAQTYATGFVAALVAMERSGLALPARGFPGVVGACQLYVDSLGERAVQEARRLWRTVSAAALPDFGAFMRSVDGHARRRLTAFLHGEEVEEDTREACIDQLAGFDAHLGGTPAFVGFVHGVAWREYVTWDPRHVPLCAAQEVRLVCALDRAAGGEDDDEPPTRDPLPWPLDFRCTCGQPLDPSMFCCDPNEIVSRRDFLAHLDVRMQVGPCERCGEYQSGFVCDACHTPYLWSLGIVPSHGPAQAHQLAG